MRWAGRVAHGEEYIQGFGGKSRKRPLGRFRRRCEDNIKMDLREIVWGDMDYIYLALDRDQWRALVNAVMNLLVPQNFGKYLSS
jgi:hypothetical protein